MAKICLSKERCNVQELFVMHCILLEHLSLIIQNGFSNTKFFGLQKNNVFFNASNSILKLT